MGNRKSAYEEVISLFDQLIKVIPRFVDGKKAILEMKDDGGRNWRQMEWIGFWFEFFLEKNLIPVLGGTRGPTFGTTQFDFKKKFVWDLKAHPSGANNLILNDQNAIKNCVESEKGLGFIIEAVNPNHTFDLPRAKLKGSMNSTQLLQMMRA